MLRQFLNTIQNALRWFWRYGLALLLFAVLFTAIVPRSTIQISDKWQAIAFDVSDHYFDYIGWEVSAIASKTQQTLFGQHAFMPEAERVQFVRDYFDDVTRAGQLDAQINAIYTDPAITTPDAASADLQHERNQIQQRLNQQRPATEAILEGQIAAVLVEEGFGMAGQLLPPMAMKLSDVPYLLVTSPRDTIRMETSLNVVPMPVDERAALENQIDARYNVSSIIVPLGGIALYPAMVYEYASIPYTVETFAHEWLHHYLYFYPLGLSYFTGEGFAGDARIINETTADLFGKQIARRVLARYYPDLVPPEPPDLIEPPAEPDHMLTPPPFDPAAALHDTRVTVDDLLAAGKVEEAEAYMQSQREMFYENGYPIRRLNQAFFAFYGGYQAGGGFPGSGGADPIGEAVRAIWEASPSPYAFIRQMRGISSREALMQLQHLLLESSNLPTETR
jgi:hypothetical protein